MQINLGVKHDSGKLRYSLLPPKALEQVVEVLTFGAQKYSPNNWKFVENAHERYFDAMQRHVWAWQSGEKTDPESGYNHLAHAACCVLFLLALDGKEDEHDETK